MRYRATIRELRAGVGWSQSELARRAGIERTRLNRCETGSERLKPEEEAAVREALRQAAEATEQRAAQVRTKLAAGVLLASVKQALRHNQTTGSSRRPASSTEASVSNSELGLQPATLRASSPQI